MREINIETKRCRLRHFLAEDLDDFMIYRNNMSWMKFQGFKGLTEAEYAKELLGGKSFTDGIQIAVVHIGEQVLIGDIYLRIQGEQAWVGYTLNPLYTGKGYAAEAVRGILGWLQAEGIREVKACVAPENLMSVNLLSRLSFCFEGTDEYGEHVYRLWL